MAIQCPICNSTKTRLKGNRGGKKRIFCNTCQKRSTVKIERVPGPEKKIVQWRELSNLAKVHSEIRDRIDFSTTIAKAKIEAEGIVLLPIGDMHFGAAGVDYDYIEKLVDYVKANDIYIALCGDEIDTFFTNFKSAKAVFNQVLNIEEQTIFLESFLTELEPHILCLTWCNHGSARAENILGFDLFGKLKSRFAPFMSGIGKLELTVGKAQYDIILTHKSSGYSKINPLNASFNLDRNIIEGDIFISGHYHSAAFSNFNIRNKNVIALQVGTTQYNDAYAIRNFRFGESKIQYPALYLSGIEKEILPFLKVESAVRYRG
jgi:hypothetical protein